MNRKLVLGLVLLGTIVAGVVVGLLLVAPGGSPRPGGPLPAQTRPAPASASALPRPEPADSGAAAQAIADAITEGDSLKFGLITCEPQTSAELKELQRKWDAAGAVTATIVRPPVVTGDRATVTIHVEGAGGEKTTDFPLRHKGAKWCVPG